MQMLASGNGSAMAMRRAPLRAATLQRPALAARGRVSAALQPRLCSGIFSSPPKPQRTSRQGTPAYASSYGQSDYSASYAPSSVGPTEEEQATALEQEELRKVAGYTRMLSNAAFWVQFALAIVSGGILLFSAAFVPKVTGVTASVFKYLTLAGVIAAFVSALFAHGFLRLSKKLQDGGIVGRGYLVTTLLTNNAFCLGGIAITVIGLQASVGTLVAKSLTTAMAGPYQVSTSSAGLVSLDVFALQASTNTLLCHVIGLVFTNLMLRAINKTVKPRTA